MLEQSSPSGTNWRVPDSVRRVVMDAVGTIIQASPGVAIVYHACGQQAGSRHDILEIRRRVAFALGSRAEPTDDESTNEPRERAFWKRVIRDVFDDVADTDALFERLWEHFGRPTSWTIAPDAEPALRALSEQPDRWAIASNFDARLRNVVAGHPALAAVPALFISSEIGWRKPHDRFFTAVEERLELHSGELLMIGDDDARDIQPARSRGWHGWHIPTSAEFADRRAAWMAIADWAARGA